MCGENRYFQCETLLEVAFEGVEMKVCIISVNNLKYVPYFKLYDELFQRHDLIVWNRENKVEFDDKADKIFSFDKCINGGDKFVLYFQYYKYVKRILKRKKYDLLVFLHSQIGVVLAPFLKEYYKGRYIADIRDFEYENLWAYRMLEAVFVKHSLINIISSNAYKSFLPKGDYNILHNDRFVEYEYLKQHEEIDFGERIVIGNIGTFRFYENNIALIEGIKNSQRITFKIYGRGTEKVNAYIAENNINNVETRGGFEFDETLALFATCNVVFNLYGNNDPALDYALSNKLYIAARFCMPVIVSPNTYMEKVTRKFGFGIVVDLKAKNIEEQILTQYSSFISSDYKSGCDRFIAFVEKENKATMDKVRESIKSLKERGKIEKICKQ